MTGIYFNFKYLFLNRRKGCIRKGSQDMKHEKYANIATKIKCWLLAEVGDLLRMEGLGQMGMSPHQGFEGEEKAGGERQIKYFGSYCYLLIIMC